MPCLPKVQYRLQQPPLTANNRHPCSISVLFLALAHHVAVLDRSMAHCSKTATCHWQSFSPMNFSLVELLKFCFFHVGAPPCLLLSILDTQEACSTTVGFIRILEQSYVSLKMQN
ncbi:unnamed protein product [Ostreobium quekettii]|uniref:Uncharacterized protein n=1 Tax=Ostreobium quekettii TaxID=121088 RepID=A0A8S1IU77_9CHLO|nr:unnamed protein product [Ostreobium quekettii]